MEHTFLASGTAEVSFNVGISGTAAQPTSVSLVLSRGTTALSYIARPVNDLWVAIIENPGLSLGTGPATFSVNVVLNNRLFVLAKATAEIVEGGDLIPASSPMQSMIDAKMPVPSNKAEPLPSGLPVDQPTLPESIKVPRKKLLDANDISKIFTVEERSSNRVFSAPIIEEKATSSPVQLQLLKSIEKQVSPKTVKPVMVEQPKIKNVKIMKENDVLFSIVKTSTVYR